MTGSALLNKPARGARRQALSSLAAAAMLLSLPALAQKGAAPAASYEPILLFVYPIHFNVAISRLR